MAYYEPQGWQAPMRQASWEQPAPPSRSGSSSTSQRDDNSAFASQFDDVDRAIDNLVKSGKLFSNIPRRDSVPLMMGRPYTDFDPRMMGIPPRHHSITDYDAMRSHSATNLQGFYASQRYQGRSNEAEQVMQAKRRMAAQRERELRNYHQEQQYNRSLLAEMSGNKSDRSLSPTTMNEESRRELIARQHRALYGNDSPAFFPNGGLGGEDNHARGDNTSVGTPTTATSGARGPSPRGVDPFGLVQSQSTSDSAGQTASAGANGRSPAGPQSRSPANSASSPGSGHQPTSYAIFEPNASQQQPHTSTSSPGGGNTESPSSRQGVPKPAATSVGPIGTRPVQQSVTSQAPNSSMSKRSTTPLPSPLSYGFAPNEVATSSVANVSSNGNERSTSSASNPSNTAAASGSAVKEAPGGVGLSWGNGSGVWGSKNSLGVQASVWG